MNIKNLNVIAVIPARGGSKRVPHKNVMPICGKPLVAYSIENAKQSKFVSSVYVSSEDADIKDIALSYDVNVVDRPLHLADDTATAESALRHVLENINQKVDLVVFLQPTSPIRFKEDIDNAIGLFVKEEADSLLSVVTFKKYIWDIYNNQPRAVNYNYRNRYRGQDFPEQYLETGSIFIFKPELLMNSNNRLGGKIVFYEMHPYSYIEIDYPKDIPICEFLINQCKKDMA